MKKNRKLFKLFFLVFISIFLLKGALSLNSTSQALRHDLVFSQDYGIIDGIYSRNAILVDRSNGEILMGKNPEERIDPASMTKIMTAMVVLDSGESLNKRVEITSDIIDFCQAEGLSMSGFEAGDKPKIKDLLYGLMLESGGEAAHALAQAIAPSEEEFVARMNEKARELSMDNSYFSNPSGLSEGNNYSTALDIAKLFNYALSNGTFEEIVSSKEYTAKGASGAFSKHLIYNKVFEKRNMLDIDKERILYGKTGYTKAAGLCLASGGRLDSREYIVVTAKADGDASTPQYNFMDTNHIYELIGR